ncbi:MAG TPA: hypothetical protein PKU91_08670, partial [Phycisphaerales bacterium]|nr:hypothetical protein [Phycisphaerales bacterium]
MAKKTSKSSKTTAGKPGSSAGGTRSPVKNKPAGKSRPAPSKGKAKVAPVKKPRPAERPKAK